jgi:hypothetical protein
MRFAALFALLALALIFGLLSLHPLGAQEPKTEPAAGDQPNPRILPVVLIKPGEEKELLLSTWCRVGATRGGGLSVGLMQDGHVQIQKGEDGQRVKLWKGNGLTIQVPDFGEAEKKAAEPIFEPLRKKGLNAFFVKVNAAKDAKLGLFNFHLADTTCSGSCDTDFRVLVAAPEGGK